jgi:hypothetical protein
MSQKRHAIGAFQVSNIVVKHSQEDFTLLSVDCLDQKLVVVGEKEKAATLAGALSRFEHHVPVFLN